MKHSKNVEDSVIPVANQLRIASINLLHSNAYLEQRYRMFDEELSQIEPDVLHIQEANLAGHKTYLENIITKHGFVSYHHSEPMFADSGDRWSSTLTLVKKDASFKTLPAIVDPSADKKKIPAIMTSFEYNGVEIVTFNVHFAWGSREQVRMREALQIEAEAQKVAERNPSAIILLAGDLNCEDSNETVRFLRGEAPIGEISTLWVDAWKMHGTEKNRVTNAPIGILNKETALSVGINYPTLIPHRRIDYIFVRGWAYGRNGSPLSFGRWADNYESGISISDHYGIWTDILVQPK
jgi:endonuclease/exonuclease/phosphatase family metal-dependent hydrolase